MNKPVEHTEQQKENKAATKNQENLVPKSSNFLTSPFDDFFETPRLLRELFSRFPLNMERNWGAETWSMPAVEVEENDKEYLMCVDLPGVAKENIKIEASGGELSIFAERSEESGSRKRGPSRRFYGSFSRTFTLPAGVDAAEITADHKDGALTIHIPKGKELKARRIELGMKNEAASGENKQTKH